MRKVWNKLENRQQLSEMDQIRLVTSSSESTHTIDFIVLNYSSFIATVHTVKINDEFVLDAASVRFTIPMSSLLSGEYLILDNSGGNGTSEGPNTVGTEPR